MSGTSEGGRKCAVTNKLKHGDDFYKRIGSQGGNKGGKVKNPNKGFGSNHDRAVAAGSKGGKVKNPNKGFGSNHDRAVAAGHKGRTQRDLNNERRRLIIKFNMLGI